MDARLHKRHALASFADGLCFSKSKGQEHYYCSEIATPRQRPLTLRTGYYYPEMTGWKN